jgi:hypothetical protein
MRGLGVLQGRLMKRRFARRRTPRGIFHKTVPEMSDIMARSEIIDPARFINELLMIFEVNS